MCSICGPRFTTPLFGLLGDRDELIRYPAHGFRLAPHCHIWSLSYRFRVIELAPKAFPPARPPPSNPDTTTNTALEAADSSIGKNRSKNGQLDDIRGKRPYIAW